MTWKQTSGNGSGNTTQRIRSEPAEGLPAHYYKRNGDPERRKHREKLSTAPFIAWDGEGYSDETGQHHYMLFGNSEGESIRGESLDWVQCFPLLLNQRHGINVIYGGDYDIIMMIKTMPYPIRQRLHAGKPVKFGGYRMEWYRRKKFMLKHLASGKSTVLYDVLSFFQCSFVKACAEYLGEDETLRDIHSMKLKRDSFTMDDETVKGYWQSELVYLVKLMDELRRLLTEVGIKPAGWHGPGAVATGLMNKHKMGRYLAPIPDAVVNVAEHAYFGGRFEHFKVGRMENVYQYDIRSAYPMAITRLPDFYGAEWRHFTSEGIDQGRLQTTIRDHWLYCVSWDIPFKPWSVGPLPWRSHDTGNIYFPLAGHRSWYWGIEIRGTLKHFPRSTWTVHEVWANQINGGDERPFSWVAQMYADRARMKAEGNPAERALKLGMNSLYGKLAQSKGSKFRNGEWKKPKWHNILAAGWITAYTRARIFTALMGCEPLVVAIETDAVFSLKPLPHLELSTALGDWEQTELEQILYVHSGVYYALKEGEWKLKTRGVEADKSRTKDDWLKVFAHLPTDPQTVTTTLRRFGTDVRLPQSYGRWYDFTTSTVLPAKASKRVHTPVACPACLYTEQTYADGFHALFVPPGDFLGSSWNSSAPYKLPWRHDVKYKWPSFIRSEIIEDTSELTWNYE